MTETSERIIAAIQSIPAGKVATYRGIALAAGLPNGARQVARLLHSMSRTHNLPWYRIIKADGSSALPEGEGRELQIALLKNEHIEIAANGKIDLSHYGFLI